MFDIVRIGQYIAFLRKNKNMTQGQLAEILGVSHQAVSNWERGEAMPDISILARLATALNTTTDRILLSGEGVTGNESTPAAVVIEPGAVQADAVVNRDEEEKSKPLDAANQNTDISSMKKSISEKHDDIRELQTTMEILLGKMGGSKTQSSKDRLQELMNVVRKQIDDLQEEVDDIQEEIDELQDEAEDTDGGASCDVFSGLRIRRDNSGAGINVIMGETGPGTSDWQDIISIAPFASRESLGKIVSELDVKNDFQKIIQLAPFLEQETIDKMITDACANTGKVEWRIIPGLAPFASEGVLELLVSKLEGGNMDFHAVSSLAPFLGREALEKILLRAYNDGEKPDWHAIMGIAPFVSGESLDLLTSKLDGNRDYENIRRLAPFLRSSTIERLILDAVKAGEKASWTVVRDLAPFADGNTLEALISGMEDSIKWQQVMEIAPFLSKGTIDRLIMNRKRKNN